MGNEWISEFNGYFFLSLAGILTGLIHITLRYCERSRCKYCEFCNCLKIEREVEIINRDASDSIA